MKKKFWIIGTLLTLLTLPAYVAGFIWKLYLSDFKSGMLKAKSFERWLNILYNKAYPDYLNQKQNKP
jgi:hypothetical protein